MITVGGVRPLAREVLRSVWRLFWNQIVTDFTSLEKKRVRRDATVKARDTHICGPRDHFSLFARRVGVLVEKLLEHRELCVGESFASAPGCGVGRLADERRVKIVGGRVRRRARDGRCPGQRLRCRGGHMCCGGGGRKKHCLLVPVFYQREESRGTPAARCSTSRYITRVVTSRPRTIF
jgi:hypothetical protein